MIVPSPISSIPLLLTIYQIRSLVDKKRFFPEETFSSRSTTISFGRTGGEEKKKVRDAAAPAAHSTRR